MSTAMPTLLRFKLALALTWVAACMPLAAQAETPRPTGRVTDLAGVLPVKDAQRLSQLLGDYERETTHQIAVLTVPSLGGESIETYALRVAQSWGLGHKGVNNGILVVLAPQDRQVRIELGLGFERHISNARGTEIIRQQMLPAFKEADYAGGLERGIEQLMQDGRGFVVPQP
ncbi:MAG: TPM domain-containing protein [Pseudomonadota bacterium]